MDVATFPQQVASPALRYFNYFFVNISWQWMQNKYIVDVGLWSSLFLLVGTFRNICAKSKFIDHRVEVTESENNYYGNFSVFVIFAPLWNYFLLFSWAEMKNVITPICIQMLIRDKFSWNMTQYGKGKILVKASFSMFCKCSLQQRGTGPRIYFRLEQWTRTEMRQPRQWRTFIAFSI